MPLAMCPTPSTNVGRYVGTLAHQSETKGEADRSLRSRTANGVQYARPIIRCAHRSKAAEACRRNSSGLRFSRCLAEAVWFCDLKRGRHESRSARERAEPGERLSSRMDPTESGPDCAPAAAASQCVRTPPVMARSTREHRARVNAEGRPGPHLVALSGKHAPTGCSADFPSSR
jgi:hypothetical protein